MHPRPPLARWHPFGPSALVLALTATLGLAQPLEPMRATGELVLREIYDVARWSLRVPWDLAYPYLVRLKLEPWLDGLPLEPAVRERVRAHFRTKGVVGEVVPFLLAVRDTYTAPADAATRTFDAEVRRHFRPGDAIPGMEHTHFAWRPPAEDSDGRPALDADVAAELVALYDALWLRDAPDGALAQRLSCDVALDDARIRVLVARATPHVRRLLELTASRLDPAGDIAPALRAVVDEPPRLETVTISLIDVVRQQVCKHYRVFATRVFREDQLRRWMEAELDRPDGGRLWDVLELANRRRYAVHVVVDGLQGHLVEALAGGEAADPFLGEVLQEHRRAASLAPATQASRPAPAQSTRFLEHVVAHGFHHPHYLPFFRRVYARPAGIARGGIATTPTISVRNIPIALTGAPVGGPGGTGIPNFHFVDRDRGPGGRAYYFYGNDAILLDELTHAAGMRTLAERLPRHSSYACAVQYDGGAHHLLDAFLNLGVGERVRDFAELRCLPDLERRAATERELRSERAALLARRPLIRERGGVAAWIGLGRDPERDLARRQIARIASLEQDSLPEYLVYYVPWPDHFAHFEGPFSDAILAPTGELARLDYWLGALSEVYEAGGVADRTLFGMAGDHGLAPVFHLLNPETEVFDRLRDGGVDFRVVKISSDEGEGPKLTNRLEPPSMRGIDVVVASTAGGNYMLDLFADQQDGWRRQPVYETLRAVRPLAGGPAVDVVDELATRLSESLDYLVVRETPCDVAGGVVRLVGTRRGRRADGWIERRGPRIHYRWRGADLLGLDTASPYERRADADRTAHAALRRRCVDDARRDDDATWCSEADWRLLASDTSRPDAVTQLAHLYDVDRAGTVNLFPRAGIGYNSKVPGRHAGELFHEKDAFVGVWGAPVVARERLRAAVNGSVPVTLYEWLAGAPADRADGWGYESLAGALLAPSR